MTKTAGNSAHQASSAHSSPTVDFPTLARAILDSAHNTIEAFRAGRFETQVLAAVLLRALLPIIPPETPLTALEVALILGVSTAYVYALRGRGQLHAVKRGRAVRFTASGVQAFLMDGSSSASEAV